MSFSERELIINKLEEARPTTTTKNSHYTLIDELMPLALLSTLTLVSVMMMLMA